MHQQFDEATQRELDQLVNGYLVLTLPVLVTAGELYGAALNSAGEIQVEDLAHVFVKTPRPNPPTGARNVGYVHVMTFEYFTESFVPGLAEFLEAH
jgi:hypothetical protein